MRFIPGKVPLGCLLKNDEHNLNITCRHIRVKQRNLILSNVLTESQANRQGVKTPQLNGFQSKTTTDEGQQFLVHRDDPPQRVLNLLRPEL